MSATNSFRAGGAGEGSEERAALDRNREEAGAAQSVAGRARARIDELDTRIDANAAQARDYEKALKRAEAEVERLREAVRGTGRRRQKLLDTRKKARKASEKAEGRARKAETRYGKSVLAALIRREKLLDQATAGPAAGPQTQSSAESGPGARADRVVWVGRTPSQTVVPLPVVPTDQS